MDRSLAAGFHYQLSNIPYFWKYVFTLGKPFYHYLWLVEQNKSSYLIYYEEYDLKTEFNFARCEIQKYESFSGNYH